MESWQGTVVHNNAKERRGAGARGAAAAVLPLPERLDLTRAQHTLSVRAQLVRRHREIVAQAQKPGFKLKVVLSFSQSCSKG